LLLPTAKFEVKLFFQSIHFQNFIFMKRFQIAGSLFNCIALAALLAACNHDEAVAPKQDSDITINDENAKINAELKLVNHDGVILQYIKSGKFTGKISKATAPGYNIEYTYSNNNPAGDLWVNRKLYAKPGNTLIEDYNYQVSNGLCITAEDVKNGIQYQYKYNAQSLLEEVKWGSKTETYTYGYSAATSSYRLAYVTRIVKHLGQIESMKKFNITYTAAVDKYPMNPQLIPFNGIDQYLPIYGKFSDVLPKEVQEVSITPDGSTLQDNKTYSYGFNGNGYVTSKTLTAGNSSWNFTYSYSSNWQGIPSL
jgi:YD repeat-containing protein